MARTPMRRPDTRRGDRAVVTRIVICGLLCVASGIALTGRPAVAAAQSPSRAEDAGSGRPAVPDSAAAAAADSVPEPAAARAAVLSEIDLWDTGIDPTLAVVMTPLFPGWGQLYALNSWRGAAAFGVEWFYWSNLISRASEARRIDDFAGTLEPGSQRDYYASVADETWEQMKDFAWWSAGILLIIALDAYVGAHLFDFDNNAMPVPNRWDNQFEAPPTPPTTTGDSLSLVLFRWRQNF
jgi:hypothetical protein